MAIEAIAAEISGSANPNNIQIFQDPLSMPDYNHNDGSTGFLQDLESTVNSLQTHTDLRFGSDSNPHVHVLDSTATSEEAGKSNRSGLFGTTDGKSSGSELLGDRLFAGSDGEAGNSFSSLLQARLDHKEKLIASELLSGALFNVASDAKRVVQGG